MNERSRPKTVEIRVSLARILLSSGLDKLQQESKWTEESGALQKGADFVKAFALGFDVKVSDAALQLATAV